LGVYRKGLSATLDNLNSMPYTLIVGRLCIRLRGPIPLVSKSNMSSKSNLSGSLYNLLPKDRQPATNLLLTTLYNWKYTFYSILTKFAFSAIEFKLAINYKYLFSSSLALLLPPSSLSFSKLLTSTITNILPL